MKTNKKPIVVAISGGMDPLHVGHVRMLEEAKKLGDKLIVILNNDNWLKNKKGYVFMPEKEREELLKHIRWVDDVVLTKHKLGRKNPKDMGVCNILRKIRPNIFANGGDRDKKNAENPQSSLYWDIQICKELGIEMIFNVGHGGKVQSSSWLTSKFIGKDSKDLKKGVDHIGVTCVFFCHDGKGNLLMQKRSQECRDEKGRWDCGSGSMELGETFEETVRREIKEEYCVNPTNLKFCGVKNVLRKNGKTHTHWVALVFAAKVNPQKAKIGEKRKIEKIGLFPTKKLPKPLHSMLKKHLATARKAGVKI